MLASRALSSADEGGPAHKKLRSTTRGVEKASKPLAAADDARSKKARARPALTLVNLFSSAGRRPQPTATSSRHVPTTGYRSERDGNVSGGGTRRSARLMSTGTKPPIPSKVGGLVGDNGAEKPCCLYAHYVSAATRPRQTSASHTHTVPVDGL